MAKTCYGGHSLTLNGDKFSMDNFAVDNDRLEIAKLVLELALLVLATKEIYSILAIPRSPKTGGSLGCPVIAADLSGRVATRSASLLLIVEGTLAAPQAETKKGSISIPIRNTYITTQIY